MQNDCFNSYLVNLQEGIERNPKNFWSYGNSKRKSGTKYPSSMTYGPTKLSSQVEIANGFNEFFKSMFMAPASKNTSDNCAVAQQTG